MAVEERKNILVITLSNIGDVILTTPVLGSLRAAFPQGRFTVVVGPKAADLLRGSHSVDRLLVYDKNARLSETLKLVRALREKFYDWVVDLRNTALPFLVRADRRSPVFRTYRATAARDYHLEVLRMMKLKTPPPLPIDFFSTQEERSLSKKFRTSGFNPPSGWVVIAPGAGSEAKRWRIEGFREVADRLLGATSLGIAVVGDTNEFSLGEQLSSADSKRVVNLCGRISLRELAALVSRAKLVLANDSACMHLAYELGRPVVALFGPSNHERYGREGPIWRIVREVPLQNLSTSRVLEASESLLNGTLVGEKH